MRCLEPDPGARFRTTAELAAELARLDDNGVPLPVQRHLTRRLVGAAALGAGVLMGATYWLTRPVPPKPAPPLTSVLVADFDDKTNNPVFKGSLEQALTTGLEGASFIAAYPRGDAQQLSSEIKPGSHLDAQMARLVSAREGIKVVLAGTVERSGDGYSLKVDAVDPAAGKVLTTASASAPSPERILAAVGAVANDLRGALGDTAPERGAAAASPGTAGSLQALQAYARALDLQAGRKDEEALAAYQQAVALDPNFGRAYAGMGVVYWNIGDDAHAKAAYDKALKFVDRMTDREKLRTLGTYYMFIARNYEKAIENYEVLVRLFPADDAGHGNLSIAYLFTGNLKGAIEQVRKVLELNPRSTTDRYNYAMYSLYASDIDTAVREGTKVAQESPAFTPGGLLPIALATLFRGNRDGALAAYGRLEKASPAGASLGRFGQADLQMYVGRYRDALNILQEAIVADAKGENSGWLARDLVALAEGYLALGQKARAVASARKAASLTENRACSSPPP
jgi:tetratricopeptide (TPR) repeat protein